VVVVVVMMDVLIRDVVVVVVVVVMMDVLIRHVVYTLQPPLKFFLLLRQTLVANFLPGVLLLVVYP
jgi:hypothetical protein